MTAKTVSARAALTTQEAARDLAETKTAALRDAVDAMAKATSDLIKKVRAKAATDGNAIYQLANIPAPSTPTNRPAPGKPYEFKIELLDNGAIEIKFKCSNPGGSAGTLYQFYRKAAGEPDTAFVYLGGTGQKKLTDAGIPAGQTSVVYQVQAVRSTAVGNWAQFNVNFGTAAGGGATATLVETTPVKIAA